MRWMDSAHTIIRPTHQIDLAKLGEDFQHQIVAVLPLDPRHQGQQQIACPDIVGGKSHPAGVLQFAGDGHGCIISPRVAPGWANRERRTRE